MRDYKDAKYGIIIAILVVCFLSYVWDIWRYTSYPIAVMIGVWIGIGVRDR